MLAIVCWRVSVGEKNVGDCLLASFCWFLKKKKVCWFDLATVEVSVKVTPHKNSDSIMFLNLIF
jgi:hypothetical protein